MTLDVPSRDFPAYARAHVIARIVDARPRTHEKSESRLVLRFETANSDPRKRVALRLELQAVASPSAVQWTTPVVIDDRFPCDPKVARNGCEQQNEDDEDSVESRLSKPQIIICDPSPAKDKKQQACASPRDSHGIYGYPGLSLAPPLADSPDASSIVSVKNNVKLEERTYFILAGPGVETILKKYP